MMEIASPSTATSTTALDDDDNIPLVEAVCIDGELTEVHPDNVIVDSIQIHSIIDDIITTPIAILADDEIITSPSTSSASSHPQQQQQSRSSICSCVSNNRNPIQEDTTRSLTVSESSSSDQQQQGTRSFHQEQQNQHTEVDSSSSVSSQYPNDDDHDHDHTDDDESQVFGAGAAGAVLGFLVGGPFLSVVLGLGTLYCSQQDGAAGDIARAMGDVALLTQTRFQELNEKHHLVDKGKEAANKAFLKIKEVEERHRNRRSRHHGHCRRQKKMKLRKFVAWCWKSMVDFESKHHLFGRISKKAKEQLDALVEQYLPGEQRDPSNESNEQPTLEQ